jgi:hypothetical protein
VLLDVKNVEAMVNVMNVMTSSTKIINKTVLLVLPTVKLVLQKHVVSVTSITTSPAIIPVLMNVEKESLSYS